MVPFHVLPAANAGDAAKSTAAATIAYFFIKTTSSNLR
jgi:hypothetical protein